MERLCALHLARITHLLAAAGVQQRIIQAVHQRIIQALNLVGSPETNPDRLGEALGLAMQPPAEILEEALTCPVVCSHH